MKRIMNGVTYNTDTSTVLAQSEWKQENERGESRLYQTRGGAFFVHNCITENWYDEEEREWRERTSDEFLPLSPEKAQAWIMDGDVEVHHNPFGDPPEAEAEPDPASTIYVRVPASLKDRVDRAAEAKNLSGNAWAMRCIEQCLEDKDLDDLPELAYIWEIASTFRAHDDGDWPREKCIEALSEIAGYAEGLAKSLFGSDDFSKIGYEDYFDEIAENLRKSYQPYS